MARRVADVRLGLQVLMGAHPRDPWSITAPLVGPAVGKPIRVAVVAAPPGGSCDILVSEVVRRAADALANAGYDVVEACPPRYEEAVAAWARLLLGDFASVMDQMMPLMGEGGKAFVRGAAILAGASECTNAQWCRTDRQGSQRGSLCRRRRHADPDGAALC
jgi:amidase